MYYTSSYLGPLGRYPVLISNSSTKFNKKNKNKFVSLFVRFCSIPFLHTTFSLPHTRLKLQRWNPWVSVCPVILKIFLFGWKVKANNSFAHNFSGSYFSFCSPFRSCSTGLRPILVKYHFSTLHYYFINISI